VRQRSELRLITDSDMALRLTMPMVVAQTDTRKNTQGNTGGATA
jgi:hypothetical protein